MAINYSSTRGGENNVTASMAILKGLAADGGLFMPDHIPALDCSLEELSHKTYQEVAYAVMKQFLTDFTEEELKTCIERAYDSKFDTEEIAPLVKADGAYYLELFHGSTIAFKDMALSILPHLMIVSAKKNHAENDDRDPDRNLRRYRKGSDGWFCRRCREPELSYFIRRTASAVCRNCRC